MHVTKGLKNKAKSLYCIQAYSLLTLCDSFQSTSANHNSLPSSHHPSLVTRSSRQNLSNANTSQQERKGKRQIDKETREVVTPQGNEDSTKGWREGIEHCRIASRERT